MGRRGIVEEAGALRGGSVWGIWVAEDSSRGRRGGFVEEEAAALRGGGFVEGAPRRICRGGGRDFPFFLQKREPGGFPHRTRQDENPMDECRTKRVSIFYCCRRLRPCLVPPTKF